ncbi:hypothetical protein G7085_11115 [Tessaracoccus sp. HDW20]|nr:hypothetical protein [Tessaracoccus coleopterorum]
MGPVVEHPVRTAADVDRLVGHELGDVSMITEAVRLVTAELGTATPLIGFAGAPFTLAAYLVEGRGSRDHLAARAMMHADPDAWRRLLAWAARLSAQFLTVQIDAGARAVQLFDSWAGSLSRADYVERVAPHSAAALAAAEGRVPRIHFGVGTGHLLTDMAACGVEAMGVDYRTPWTKLQRCCRAYRCRATSTRRSWPQAGRRWRRTPETSSSAGRRPRHTS